MLRTSSNGKSEKGKGILKVLCHAQVPFESPTLQSGLPWGLPTCPSTLDLL